MKRRILLGLVALIMVSCLACTEAWSQFTQGPPGNPSAAGIISGTSAPSAPPPRSLGSPGASPQSGMAFGPGMGAPYATTETNASQYTWASHTRRLINAGSCETGSIVKLAT